MTNNQLTPERISDISDYFVEMQDHYSDPADRENFEIFRDAELLMKELQERRKAERDSESVGYFGRFDPDDEDLIDQCSKNVKGAFPLYRHAQPAPELSAIVDRLNASGYEYEDGEVTPQNAAAVVDMLLRQLDDAVQGRDAQPAPVVPDYFASLVAAARVRADNDVTNGKPLTINLPDTSSKAFWSGSGKAEVFHPETYKRWVKEAIVRYCAIARIDVEVK